MFDQILNGGELAYIIIPFHQAASAAKLRVNQFQCCKTLNRYVPCSRHASQTQAKNNQHPPTAIQSALPDRSTALTSSNNNVPVPSPDSNIEVIVPKTLAGHQFARGLTNDSTNILGNYQRTNLLKQAQERVATQALTTAQQTIATVV